MFIRITEKELTSRSDRYRHLLEEITGFHEVLMKIEIASPDLISGYYVVLTKPTKHFYYIPLANNEKIIYIKPGVQYSKDDPKFIHAMWIHVDHAVEVILSNREAMCCLIRR
jgi:hypothetical protein